MSKLLFLYVGTKRHFRSSMAQRLKGADEKGAVAYIKKEKPPRERFEKILHFKYSKSMGTKSILARQKRQ